MKRLRPAFPHSTEDSYRVLQRVNPTAYAMFENYIHAQSASSVTAAVDAATCLTVPPSPPSADPPVRVFGSAAAVTDDASTRNQ